MSEPTVILQEQGEYEMGLGGTQLTEEDQKRYSEDTEKA